MVYDVEKHVKTLYFSGAFEDFSSTSPALGHFR